jgi:hypothetical protein
VICCEFINQDRGRSNTAFEQEEDDGRLSSSTPVRNPPKARQRQQVRDPSSANNEFNNAAFEQDDDQQSITPPPPYPSEPITADGQVRSHNEQKKTRENYHIASINSFEDIAKKNVKCCIVKSGVANGDGGCQDHRKRNVGQSAGILVVMHRHVRRLRYYIENISMLHVLIRDVKCNNN